VAGCKVDVFSTANIKVAEGVTDTNGWCFVRRVAKGTPFVVVATSPSRDDMSFLALRSSMEVDETFPERAKAEGGGMLVAGANYGQGSSREHAALVPLYLGIRAVAAKSFARIHQANLINNGILPLTFADEKDYDRIDQGDTLSLPGVREKIAAGEETLELKNETKNETYAVKLPLTERQRGMILSGGLINFIRSNA
jgi:aconitate hydratase